MKWIRNILSCEFKKEEPQFEEARNLRIFTCCGWGSLTEFSSNGRGYVTLDRGGGLIIRNWDHFLETAIQIETE